LVAVPLNVTLDTEVVGAVGEEEAPPPHPTVVPTSSTAITPTTSLRSFSMR
jgi:hypothetical protein